MYSGYVLYDVFCTNRSAYTSSDMLFYKRQLICCDECSAFSSGQGGFAELLKLNPDVVGWVDIADTNINYPIMQGSDDLEYASKDFKGEGSLSGSIYLSAENSSDFSDCYNLVFGHHMKNGAMFGELENFTDEDFFYRHLSGTLQTPAENYKLRIFACVLTDAYDSMIYKKYDGAAESLNGLITYISGSASVCDSKYLSAHAPEKITAFSTCADALTNGRAVVFADTIPCGTAVTSADNTEKTTALTAVGHTALNGQGHWAFLDLLCMILTLLVLLPLFRVRCKYGQISYTNERLKEINAYILCTEESGKTPCKAAYKVRNELKAFRMRMKPGILIESFFAALSAAVFFLTQDITMPLVMSDDQTWLMVVIFTLSLLTDVVCFRGNVHFVRLVKSYRVAPPLL